ncbi:MAG: hypothetical protein GY839_05040 [candidate division Zixibacteria bacterium]|nr:hypothetical protein [candidate division Zixibacteria bacterium]
MNPNDQIRRLILQWFYERNANATSQYGKKGSATKISDVKKGLKEVHSLSQQQVISNLNYLIDKGWVNKSEIEKTVKVKGGTIPSTVTWYVISSAGIDKIEGESEFKEGGKYAGINIHATGSNVITLGDGNIVNAEYEALHSELSKLKNAVTQSSLDESQKLDVSVDIESLKDQLVKANPDKTIIGHIWARIQDIATIGGFIDAVSKVTPLISGLLPS